MAVKRTLPEDFQAFADALRGESDRAAAVLGAAYLDAQLEQLFKARLVDDAPPDVVYGPQGLLGSFSAKIDMSYSLGWISADGRSDLKLVRDMRNEFAHDPNHALSFDGQSLSARTENFKGGALLHELFRGPSEHPEADKARAILSNFLEGAYDTPRRRFEMAVAYLRALLQHAIATSVRAAVRVDNVELREALLRRDRR